MKVNNLAKQTGRFLAFLLLSLSLVLSVSAQAPSFTPSPEGTFVPVQATVESAILGACNLTNTADDYFTPQGTYFNGVKLQVLAIEPTYGDYPLELDDPLQLWARVSIGKTDQFDGITGFMPLVSLNFGEKTETAKLPEAILAGEGEVNLYRSDGLSDQEQGRFPAGTQATILGWLKDWVHVEIAGQTGFVKPEQLTMDDATLALVQAAMPNFYDEIQPGYQQKYAEYTDQLLVLYDKYGDSNDWPLDINAQASSLAISYGYEFTDVVNVMPDSSDLTEAEVFKLAAKAALELFSLDESSWADYSFTFSHPAGEPENKGWKVNLWANPGTPDCVIWLDRTGAVVDSLLNDYASADEWDDGYSSETLEEALSYIDYYMYGVPYELAAGDMTQKQAEDAAWEMFSQEIDVKERAAYQFTAETFRNDDNTLSWWLVSIGDPVLPDYSIVYYAALVLPDGEQRIASDTAMYLDEQAWSVELIKFQALEKERGPLHTWSLEEKAQWDPEYYGLPKEGEINQETALKTAREQLIQRFNLTEAEIDSYAPAFFFEIYGARVWNVLFIPKLETPETESSMSYAVIIDAESGNVIDWAGPEMIEQ